jgi:23S rRNA (cytidine1920-2'-O)/16S rRNA (cytidine1409-2'-O)-methyltransferase
VRLADLLGRRDPPLDDPAAALAEFRVLVDGAIVTNPDARVRPDAAVVVRPRRRPQGVRKLGLALDRLDVAVTGRTGLDVGACTGGFTMALLERGAARVVAADVGYGQLLGSLQQDERVVNMERTNIADLTPERLTGPGVIDGPPGIIVADVTKVSLREVGRQLADQRVPGAGTDLVGLVKPMFELGIGSLPTSSGELGRALDLASDGLAGAGWEIVARIESAVRGHRGAVEYFVHARWPA